MERGASCGGARVDGYASVEEQERALEQTLRAREVERAELGRESGRLELCALADQKGSASASTGCAARTRIVERLPVLFIARIDEMRRARKDGAHAAWAAGGG